MGAWAALFAFTARQILWQRKIWVTLMFLAVPAGISLIMRFGDDKPDAWEQFHGPMQFALFAFAIPLACLLYGAELIGSEVEGRTIVYLVTRRMRRTSVLMIRFAAVATVLSVLFGLAALGTFAAALWGPNWKEVGLATSQIPAWSPWGALKVYGILIPPTTAAFVATFTMFGLAASRPLGLSLWYFGIIETLVSNLPATVRQYSILHFVRQSMFAGIPNLFSLYDVPKELRSALYPANANGIPVLLGVMVVALALTCILVTTRELVPAKIVKE